MYRVSVETELLRWARERSGRSAEYLHKHFPKLKSWERGEVLPTFKQLERFSRATHTPIGFLFLQKPPVEELPIIDFRTMGDRFYKLSSPDLLDTIYLCQQRQDWYREESRTAGEPLLKFVGSLNENINVEHAGALLRRGLGFELEQRRQVSTWTEARRQFIELADNLGILVMVSGVVGSNTYRKLNPEEFRGFALSDPLAPLIFINGADTVAAQIFTLAHEIAHLWLGESGVSNSQLATKPSHAIEKWCDQVAAELLVPIEPIRADFNRSLELNEEVSRLARRFKVSTLVVLRRIHDTGELDRDEFLSAYREEVRHLQGLSRSRGGNAVNNVGARASKRFTKALVASTLEGRTSYTEAFRLLGVKTQSTFEKVAATLGVGT